MTLVVTSATLDLATDVDVVIPTIGRPSLTPLLAALTDHPTPPRIVVIDDRRDQRRPLWAGAPGRAGDLGGLHGRLSHRGLHGHTVAVLAGKGAGPAAARNIGWRAGRAPWVVFLDDDVVLGADWHRRLATDLAGAHDEVGGVQACLMVPQPEHRRPTDWERNVAGLASARWITADMAYRRPALASVGGFDERFPRAYREDADLAARVQAAGWRLVVGERETIHPVRPADRWISVRLQRGNADDALLRSRYGRRWREIIEVPAGRRNRHLAITAAGLVSLVGLLARRRTPAIAGGLGWLAGTVELAWARIAPGPRSGDEIATMLVTSAVIPAAATWHWLRGWTTSARRRRRPTPPSMPTLTPVTHPQAPPWIGPPAAVLFDRDGTLVVDVAYNGDPTRVVPMPGAAEALALLRDAGIPTAVVSNQSGVAKGLIDMAQVEAVNRRVEALLGPLGPWAVCPHAPEANCGCRKPNPGLIVQAAAALGVPVERVAVIGDIGADIEAARAIGARSILVPTAATRPEERAAAPEVAPDLASAVELLLASPSDTTGWGKRDRARHRRGRQA